jgi:non-canonical purine NTP pyrophosphatase (RdgB/HAM1 family)
MNITFITGNQGKADFLARHLDLDIAHHKLDLDEVQSLDIQEVVEHKARQAYKAISSPVLVEDVSLTLDSLGKLPGPFIKWFEISMGLERFCKIVARLESQSATVTVCFAYFDGSELKLFEGSLKGLIAPTPRGQNGFGFDPVFIPEGSKITLAEISEKDIDKVAIRTTQIYPKIKEFLTALDKN